MQSRKIKPEPNISEAAEKTGVLIRGLQSRLLEGAGEVLEESGETNADLEKQLHEYFKGWPAQEPSGSAPLIRLRNHVLDGVVDRILRGWQDGKNNPLENEVIERLIEGVLEMLASDNGAARMPRSLTARPKSATSQLPGSQMRGPVQTSTA